MRSASPNLWVRTTTAESRIRGIGATYPRVGMASGWVPGPTPRGVLPGACSPGLTPHFSGKWLDTLKFQHISLAGVHTGLSDRSDVVWPAPVWAFAEVGDRVFVGGRFTQVRRGPAPPGTTSRSWRPSTGTAASDVGRAVGDPR